MCTASSRWPNWPRPLSELDYVEAMLAQDIERPGSRSAGLIPAGPVIHPVARSSARPGPGPRSGRHGLARTPAR